MGMFDFVFGGGVGGGNAPDVDPNVALQAGRSSALADKISGQADTELARKNSLYNPIEQQFITDAQNIDSQANQEVAAGSAGATVRSSFGKAAQIRARQLAAMGINPGSGAALDTNNQVGMVAAAGEADAMNIARQTVKDRGIQLRAGVVNQGNVVAGNVLNAQQLALGGIKTAGDLYLGKSKANTDAADVNAKAGEARLDSGMNLLGGAAKYLKGL